MCVNRSGTPAVPMHLTTAPRLYRLQLLHLCPACLTVTAPAPRFSHQRVAHYSTTMGPWRLRYGWCTTILLIYFLQHHHHLHSSTSVHPVHLPAPHSTTVCSYCTCTCAQHHHHPRSTTSCSYCTRASPSQHHLLQLLDLLLKEGNLPLSHRLEGGHLAVLQGAAGRQHEQGTWQ
jgi:hypothetical protein